MLGQPCADVIEVARRCQAIHAGWGPVPGSFDHASSDCAACVGRHVVGPDCVPATWRRQGEARRRSGEVREAMWGEAGRRSGEQLTRSAVHTRRR